MGFRGKIFTLFVLVLALALITPAFAAERQKLGDAWWTGPLQTPNAGTIPKNHWYVETYFVVEQDNGAYANSGTKYSANSPVGRGLTGGYLNDYQSTTLFTYGVTNKFNAQILLGLDGAQGKQGFNCGTAGACNNGMEVGLLRVRLPYKLHSYKEGKWAPTFTFVPEVNAPVGLGYANVWQPGFGLWAIRPFWMPNGRILRIRASEDLFFPKGGKVTAPGTSVDFAKYGVSQFGFEYSLTKHWVPAFDFVWKYYGQNKTNGVANTCSTVFNTTTGVGSSPAACDGRRDYRIDPALEYNFTENTGVIFGVELTVGGRNTTSYIAPQIALQWFK